MWGWGAMSMRCPFMICSVGSLVDAPVVRMVIPGSFSGCAMVSMMRGTLRAV